MTPLAIITCLIIALLVISWPPNVSVPQRLVSCTLGTNIYPFKNGNSISESLLVYMGKSGKGHCRPWGWGEDVPACERKVTWFSLQNCPLFLVWLHLVSAPLWPQLPVCPMGQWDSIPMQCSLGSTLRVCESCFRTVSWALDTLWWWRRDGYW